MNVTESVTLVYIKHSILCGAGDFGYGRGSAQDRLCVLSLRTNRVGPAPSGRAPDVTSRIQ